jgi:hypothetical protein
MTRTCPCGGEASRVAVRRVARHRLDEMPLNRRAPGPLRPVASPQREATGTRWPVRVKPGPARCGLREPRPRSAWARPAESQVRRIGTWSVADVPASRCDQDAGVMQTAASRPRHAGAVRVPRARGALVRLDSASCAAQAPLATGMGGAP